MEADDPVRQGASVAEQGNAGASGVTPEEQSGSVIPPLEDARSHLAAILDSTDDAIVTVSLDGVIRSWNRGAEQMLGWTAAEAVGRPVVFILPEERRAEVETILARLRRGETLDHFPTVRVAKDGRRVDVWLTVSPVRNAAGCIVAAAEIARDATEHGRLEEARSHLAAIIDSADDAIVSKSLDGVIRSWNRGAERMFGWTAAEAVGRHITLIIPDERRAEEDDILARLRRGESLDHFETVRVTKDGRRLNISLTVSPVKNIAGRIIGASKIARDVTERRRLEDERDRLLIEAEASNRAKDHLLATVSHELRTPLNSILGYARLLENDSLDEAARRRALSVISRSATIQGQLIDDLLDLSRVVTGRMQITLETCDLPAVVDSALEVVRPAADAKRITLCTAIAPDVGPVRCATDRLRQVVWNLAMNAIKFTPAGGRVDVRLQRSDTHAEIVVVDNGVGIEPDLLPHVFELFRQGDSSSTRLYRGLGLGLALVKSLVELHGGHVEAQSGGKGQGASFTVRLPLAAVPGPDTVARERV
jgi:PAS domain S-box-containing protein